MDFLTFTIRLMTKITPGPSFEGWNRRVLKLALIPKKKTTFKGLSDWYLNLETTRSLASWFVIEIRLRTFNAVFGYMTPDSVKPEALKEYQLRRKKEGSSPATIDQEFRKVKSMLHKAFENDKISYNVIGVFKKVKRTLKKGSDVRNFLTFTIRLMTKITPGPSFEGWNRRVLKLALNIKKLQC